MSQFADHIPFLKPWTDDDELREVTAVLQSGWISQGPKVKEFEDQVAALIGVPNAVATNSATSALHLALQVSGLKRGDKVILPAHTCMATANAVILAGGIPVFADIDQRTFNLDPKAVEALLDDTIRAIVLVHQIGLPADIDAFNAMARRRQLILVEDAATAFGAKYHGRSLGAHGNPAVFSFHPRKIITTAEGGMLVLFNSAWTQRARRLRAAGADISDLRRHEARGVLQQVYPEPGYNYRLTDIQAAIGIAQLRKLHRMLEHRARQAQYYNEHLMPLAEVLPPYVPPYATPCYSSYCITLPQADAQRIDQIINHMASRGISCRRGIPSLCAEPYFKETCKDVVLPHTDAAATQTMFLPIFPGLTVEQQAAVVTALTEAIAKYLRPAPHGSRSGDKAP